MMKDKIARSLFAAALGVCFLFVGARPAAADGVTYQLTSTYTSNTSTSAYSAPNTAFTLTFSEPSTLSSLSTVVPISFTLGSGSSTYSGVVDVIYYSLSQLGLFDVDATIGGDTYTWEFFGPQVYSGNNAPYTLATGTFPIDGSGTTLSEFSDSQGKYSGNFSGGTVTAVRTPEPSTIVMLACGLLSVGLLFGSRLRLAPAKE